MLYECHIFQGLITVQKVVTQTYKLLLCWSYKLISAIKMRVINISTSRGGRED